MLFLIILKKQDLMNHAGWWECTKKAGELCQKREGWHVCTNSEGFRVSKEITAHNKSRTKYASVSYTELVMYLNKCYISRKCTGWLDYIKHCDVDVTACNGSS